jgi:hypothetical protein
MSKGGDRKRSFASLQQLAGQPHTKEVRMRPGALQVPHACLQIGFRAEQFLDTEIVDFILPRPLIGGFLAHLHETALSGRSNFLRIETAFTPDYRFHEHGIEVVFGSHRADQTILLLEAGRADPLVEGVSRIARTQRAAAAPRTAPNSASGAVASSGPAPVLPEPVPEAVVDKAYIRRAVRELIPLLRDCYDQGLERDPKLAGTVTVDFTIEGEPAVGGVIGHSAIDPAGTALPDAAARECIQETMYALEIDPPADGGVVTVRYPFAFSSDGSSR